MKNIWRILMTYLRKNNGELFSARQQAAGLIDQVLMEEKSVRYALNHWPRHCSWDLTLQAAYQALWHFEADETQQQQELFYLDVQLELLRDIARYLQQGKALPEYIIQGYSQAHFIQLYDEGLYPWLKQGCYRGSSSLKKVFSVMKELFSRMFDKVKSP